ncbi:unnamed protein product [Gulo gulo]|uniref:Uncharacterized protein n=1 Tax=Gulo gulo TaxID=48420 RepID=A0A9X9LFD7_GULGU|nr:unnamed protein product [Gulo gulo]
MPASSGLTPSSLAWRPSPWPTCSTSGPSASLRCGPASCCPSPSSPCRTTASCCSTFRPARPRRWRPTPWSWPPCCGAAWPAAGASAGGPCFSRSRTWCWRGTPSCSRCRTPASWS